MKRLITLCAAIAFAGQAWAVDYFDIDNLRYFVIQGTKTVTVTYAETKPEGDIIIHSTVENDGKTYTVTSIENGAFSYCVDMKSISIPNTVTHIGGMAFSNCSGLTSITIPNSVTSIEAEVFKGCSSLQSITFPYVYKQPFGYIFGGSAYEGAIRTDQVEKTPDGEVQRFYRFYIPQSLNSVIVNGGKIVYGAFKNCIGLSSVVIGDSVESIGEDAFYGCNSLTSIVIGESVDSIDSFTFRGCNSLSSVIIKSDVNLSGSDLWIKKDGIEYRVENKNTVSVGCKLQSSYSGDIIIPATVIVGGTFDVKSIGPYAFSHDSITSITIPNSVTEIGEAAFSHCGCLTSITIPNSVVSIGGWVFPNCSSLTEINVESGNTEYVSVDGVLFNKDKTILISYPAGKTGEYTIPSSVKTIATHAFSGCSNETTVIIPNSVDCGEYYAFYDCTATVKCMVNEIPYGWDIGWCGYDENFKGVVVWGYTPTPITESAANAVNIYVYGKTIVVENAAEEIRVYDVMGKLVCRDAARHVSTITVNGTGAYIVKVGDVVKRVVIN